MKEKVYKFIAGTGIKVLTKIFPEYFASEPLRPTDRYLEYPFVFKNLPKLPAKILDVGSAGSFFPLIVSSLGYDVTGCDIRPYKILNKVKFNNFTFLQKNICEHSLQEEGFDVVTCISVLEHIGLKGRYGSGDDSEGDIKMVEEIKRVLKPGGRAIITVPFGKAEVFAPYQRIYNLAGIKIISSGFEIIEQKFYCLNKNDDWCECSGEHGETFKGSASRYGLALLCLKK